MDQKARRRIAAKAQNLYRVLPNKPAWSDEFSFFNVIVLEGDGIVVGITSSFICVLFFFKLMSIFSTVMLLQKQNWFWECALK